MPHPACTEPTPDEEYQRSEHLRQQHHQDKEQQAKDKHVAQQQQGGGGAMFKVGKIFSTVSLAVEKTASDVHATAEAKARQIHVQHNQDRFNYNFPELVAAGDLLIADYTCKVMHQGQQINGNLQITSRNLCFVSDTLKEAIPYSDLCSVIRSISLETVDNGPPYIMPIPAGNVLPNTLQCFTLKQQLFQFFVFESTVIKVGSVLTSSIRGRPVDRAYNFLDHAWRAAVQVPMPNVQYSQH